MQFKKILIMVAALTLINCMSHAVAKDDEKNDGLAQVVLITARDGQEKALEEAITAYHHFMADKKGAWRYQWYSIVTGPDTGKYIARSGNHNWADFDAEHDWDEEAGASFINNVQPHIADADFTIAKTDDELGIWPESMEGYKYFSITNWYVKAGQGKAFNDGLKKINEALKGGGFPSYYAFTHPVSGGRGDQVTLVSPRKSFADMAPKEPSFYEVMNKALGEEETTAFLAEWSTTYKVGDKFLLEYRPELSNYGDSDYSSDLNVCFRPRPQRRGILWCLLQYPDENTDE